MRPYRDEALVMPKTFVIFLLFILFTLVGQAQTIPAQRLLLLIAGPSGDRISPTEQSVVSYLNQLRGEYGLYDLQMGTMHFDRPQEASILKGNLGFNPQAGVTVGLVQLSDQGMPVRTIYKAENVTRSTLDQEHRKLLSQWSQLSEKPLPEALAMPAVPTNPANPPNTNSSPPPLNPPVQQEVYTFEGIRTVVFSLQQKTSDLWNDFRNQPSRDDRMDVPVRNATLKLLESTTNLKTQHEAGVIFPLNELAAVRAAALEWKLTEPEFYLPPHLRTNVNPILDLIQKVEAIEYQGRQE